MSVTSYIKQHPYASGTIAVIGGIIFIVIVRGSGGSSASASNSLRPSDAEITANAAIQAATIQANAQTAAISAQAGAAVNAAQIGAGVQLNSDNKAAEVALATIAAQRDLIKEQLDSAEAVRLAAVNNIGKFGGKGAYDEQKAAALQTIFSGQNATIPIQQSQNNAGQIINGIGSAIGSIGSLFSDQRLKENIRLDGYDAKGREVYSWNYKGSSKRRRGYMAQSLARSEPELVREDAYTGYMTIPAYMQVN